MRLNAIPVEPFVPTRNRPTVLPQAVVAATFLGALVCAPLAETIIGDLDSLDDVAVMAAGSDRIMAAGLIHYLGAVLLGFAVVGLAPLVWRSITGRIGWFLLVVNVACLGAFAMLHLLALEAASPGLDAVAMNEFLVERISEAAGPWVIPIAIMAPFKGLAELLLAIGLVRHGITSWWAPGLILLGTLVHAVGVGPSFLEYLSHWVVAAGVGVAAYGVWQLGRRESAALGGRAIHLPGAVRG